MRLNDFLELVPVGESIGGITRHNHHARGLAVRKFGRKAHMIRLVHLDGVLGHPALIQKFTENLRPVRVGGTKVIPAEHNDVRINRGGLFVQYQGRNQFSAQYMIVKNLLNLFGVHLLILERNLTFYENADDRFPGAPSGATGLFDHDVVSAGRADELLEFLPDALRTGGILACRRSDVNHTMNVLVLRG